MQAAYGAWTAQKSLRGWIGNRAAVIWAVTVLALVLAAECDTLEDKVRESTLCLVQIRFNV